MRKTSIVSVIAVVAAVALSGCAPARDLDTAALREEAVHEELERVADALSEFDAPGIEQLQCEQPWSVKLPRPAQLDPAVTLPLAVELGDIEPLDLSASNHDDPDPDAEFHLASMRVGDTAPAAAAVSLPDVVVRVDDREACVWAMGPPFTVLFGL